VHKICRCELKKGSSAVGLFQRATQIGGSHFCYRFQNPALQSCARPRLGGYRSRWVWIFASRRSVRLCERKGSSRDNVFSRAGKAQISAAFKEAKGSRTFLAQAQES